MRSREFITETFNSPYPVKVVQSPESDNYEAGVKLPDGDFMEILFTEDPIDSRWEVEFYRGASLGITGRGDAFRVFATMIEAIRQFIKLEKPSSIIFSATKELEDDDVGNKESRANLYRRMVTRFANSMGYNVVINDYADREQYELKRKNIEKTSETVEAEQDMAALLTAYGSPNKKKKSTNESRNITEAFTDPYPVRVLVSNDEAHHADAYLDDGSRLEIRFDLADPDYGEQWDLEFLRDDTQKITGEKDAFRIFATVIEAIKQFIKSRSPDVISFSAEKNYDGESRFKLYKRMVDKLANQLGYVARIDDKGHYADFELFRSSD